MGMQAWATLSLTDLVFCQLIIHKLQLPGSYETLYLVHRLLDFLLPGIAQLNTDREEDG